MYLASCNRDRNIVITDNVPDPLHSSALPECMQCNKTFDLFNISQLSQFCFLLEEHVAGYILTVQNVGLFNVPDAQLSSVF